MQQYKLHHEVKRAKWPIFLVFCVERVCYVVTHPLQPLFCLVTKAKKKCARFGDCHLFSVSVTNLIAQ